jgi:hypothetical protein
VNISEANDVNVLLRWITGTTPRPTDIDLLDEADVVLMEDEDAKQAATRLAERAHTALHAGLTAAHVEQLWQRVSLEAPLGAST